MVTSLNRSDFTRVWLIEDSAGPANAPDYQGLMKATNVAWPQGDIELIRIPDPDEYGKFLTADKIPGEQGTPGLSLMARYLFNLSDLLRILRRGCDVDVQIHMGKCQDPQDFNFGWEKVLILERARITDYTIADLGALSPDERAVVNEEVPVQGEDLYEVKAIIFAEQAASEVVQEVIDIEVCDRITCGICELPSTGCDKVFALTLTAGGSPGLSAEVIFSDDGGVTWDDTLITTLAANEDPDAMACVGLNLVVVSNDSCSLHYAPLADILATPAGSETWTEVTAGFVCPNGEPNAIFSISPRHTWIVGDNGYIYFTEDPTTSVIVQDAGVATNENLVAIHGYDKLNVVAVGENNVLVVTENGGDTWTLVVGPVVGADLTTIWMRSVREWLVGTIQGELWYTRDAGVTWVEKEFPGTATGQVREIKFSTPSVGWMAHDNDTPNGRILRTIDGGYSWYVAPQGNTTIPVNNRINAIAVCEKNANVIYGGGLADGAVDGIIVKGS